MTAIICSVSNRDYDDVSAVIFKLDLNAAYIYNVVVVSLLDLFSKCTWSVLSRTDFLFL